jgi:hypothetical protein
MSVRAEGMRPRTLGALLLVGACAQSSPVGFTHDSGKGRDAAEAASPDCGRAGQACCVAPDACHGSLVCVGGICGVETSPDGGDEGECPFVLCHGRCTDVQSDAKNCGICDHDCQGTSCAEGFCSAKGIAVGTSPAELVVDATHVYFTDVTDTDGIGSVNKVASEGGTVQVLAASIPDPFGIAVDANYVYFTSGGTVAGGFGDGAVLKVPINPDGGGSATPIPIATARSNPEALVIDSSSVYWIEPGTTTGALLKCPLTGCPANVAVVLVDVLEAPYGLAIDSTSVYVTSSGGGEVDGIDKVTGAIRVIARMQNQPEGIAVANGMVYWTTNLDGLVQAAPVTGDGGTQFIATTMGAPQGVAADAVNVYWSDVAPILSFGPVESCAIAGCPPATALELVDKDETATNIAIDSLFVYWIDDNGQILRVAK